MYCDASVISDIILWRMKLEIAGITDFYALLLISSLSVLVLCVNYII